MLSHCSLKQSSGGMYSAPLRISCSSVVSFCTLPRSFGNSPFLGQGQEHGEQNGGVRGVVGHNGNGDLVQWDAPEQLVHILYGVDTDSGHADPADGHGIVGIVHLNSGQIKEDIEPGGPVIEHELHPLVGVFRGAEPGQLAHGEVATSVHVGMDAPGERLLSWVAQVCLVLQVGAGKGGEN